jgi:hypothetical protein
MSNSNKDFKFIYEPTNYKQVFISMGVTLVLFLITMYALLDNMHSIIREQRTYDKFSVEEIEWRKRTQHNLNRPQHKKFNI